MIGVVVNTPINNLPMFRARFSPEVASAMRTGMLNFLRVANAEVPVDTGMLRSNRTHVWPQIGFFGGIKGAITYNQEYAGFVHHGTRYQKANPWADRSIDVIHDDYIDGIRRAVEGIAG